MRQSIFCRFNNSDKRPEKSIISGLCLGMRYADPISKMKNFIWMAILFLGLLTSGSPGDLKIWVAQMKVRPGDFKTTMEDLTKEYLRAVDAGADLFITPEGIIPGYPSNDLLFEHDYIQRSVDAAAVLQELTKGHKTAMVLGHIGLNPSRTGRPLQNFLSVFENGQLMYRQAKVLLPTYGPFNDLRYFEPGKISDMKPFLFRGKRISFVICEDGWHYDRDSYGRLPYKHNTILRTKKNKPDFVISLSASPSNAGKQALREDVHRFVSELLGVPLLWINQYGAVDGLEFDGATMLIPPDPKQPLLMKLASFESDSALLTLPKNPADPIRVQTAKANRVEFKNETELVMKALAFGLEEHVRQTGFDSIVLALDGSLNSAWALVNAVQAMGAEKVFAILPSSERDGDQSAEDSHRLLKNLGIPENNKLTLSADYFSAMSSFPEKENEFGAQLAARDPKWAQFFKSKKFRIQTINKSQLATGNSSLLSELAGDVAPNADLLETDIRKLAEYFNKINGRLVIPVSFLKEDSVHQKMIGHPTINTLPSYQLIDPLIKDIVRGRMTPEALAKKYADLDPKVEPRLRPVVGLVLELFNVSENKRQISQATLIRVTNWPLGKEFAKPIMGIRNGHVPSLSELILSRRAGQSCQRFYGL